MNNYPATRTDAIHAIPTWSRPVRWLPWLVLAVSLSITYQLWEHEQHNAEEGLQAEFDFRAREANNLIEQRIRAYEQVLRGVAGLFTHANNVTRQEFRDYFDRLHLEENYPGIQGLAFSRIVPLAQIDRHIAAIRKEGYPNYSIKPEGQREIYAPVIYIEPFSGRNLRAFGHDPYSDPARRTAMEKARDFGQAAISGKVKLVQETEQHVQAGFLMYLPIYRNGAPHEALADRRANIIGWVSAPFRMDDLMVGLLGPHSSLLDFEIYDGEEMSEQTLMHDSDNDPGSRLAARFQALKQIGIAGRTWTVATRSHAGFEERLGTNRPQLIAYSGIGISLLLTLLTWLLVSSRARAIKIARAMNRELIESKTRYQQMFDDVASIAFLLDPGTGSIVDANTAAAEFWGYTQEELRSMSIAHINVAQVEDIREAMIKVKAKTIQHLEWQHRLKNGEIRDVEVYSSPLNHQGKTLLYCVLHDITERKSAQNALHEQKKSLHAFLRAHWMPWC